MFKNLMIRRNNDFFLLQLGIGDFYRFWTEGQVEVGRSPAFSEPYLGADLEYNPNTAARISVSSFPLAISND